MNCNHEYITGEVFEDVPNCKHCGLLKSTIEYKERKEMKSDSCRGCGVFKPTDPKDSMATPLNASGDVLKKESWMDKIILEMQENMLIKILAEMESAPDAKSCRHILKEYLLHEK